MVLFTVHHIPIVNQAQRMAHKIGLIDEKKKKRKKEWHCVKEMIYESDEKWL